MLIGASIVGRFPGTCAGQLPATDLNLEGFGRVIHSADEVSVENGNFEIKQWPQPGWREMDPNTGDEAGTPDILHLLLLLLLLTGPSLSRIPQLYTTRRTPACAVFSVVGLPDADRGPLATR